MFLNNELIETTLCNAECKYKELIYKYSSLLSLGIKRECMFKNILLLSRYIKILKCFKIIDEDNECNCKIPGKYSVTLDNGLIYNFQFLNDNTGTLVTPWNTYTFIYQNNCNSNQLYIQFPDVFEIIYVATTTLNSEEFVPNEYTSVFYEETLIFENNDGFSNINDFIIAFNNEENGYYLELNNDGFLIIKSYNLEVLNNDITICTSDTCVTSSFEQITGNYIFETLTFEFDENCNFNIEEGFPWYYETTLDITGTPVPFEDSLITITLFDPYGTQIFTVDFPITWTQEELDNFWNTTSPYKELFLQYLNSQEINFTTDFGVFYNNYSILLQQYEGGTDGTCIFSIDTTTLTGPGLIQIIVDGNIIYSSSIDFTTLQEFIDDFNNNNTLEIIVSSPNALQLSFTSPEYSFEEYNGIVVEIFNYKGIYTEYTESYSGGINPNLQFYENIFSLVDSSENFINNNPCESEKNEKVCLDNDQIKDIIEHVNRIIKNK